MDWLGIRQEPAPSLVLRVKEVRFTQGVARLHRVGLTMDACGQRFSSSQASPEPADPVSHRFRVSWQSAEIRLPSNTIGYDDIATICIIDRPGRARLRSTIAAFDLSLTAALTSALCNENGTYAPSLSASNSINEALNIKVELELQVESPKDSCWDDWRHSRSPCPSEQSSLHTSLESSDKHSMSPPPNSHMFMLSSEVVGVLFLEIVGCTNLPKFRTLTGISFDMDPFLVVSFGDRTFKTRYRRHTLNPTFQERLLIDVTNREQNWDVIFNVWDKDRITLNDKVASARVNIHEFAAKGPHQDPVTLLYDLNNYAPTIMSIPLDIPGSDLLLKVMYYPYPAIRQRLWRSVIYLYDTEDQGRLDFEKIVQMLNALGSNLSHDDIANFWNLLNVPKEQDLSVDHLVRALEHEAITDRVVFFRICPFCRENARTKKQSDSLRHLVVCASRHWVSESGILRNRYVSSEQASRRWYVSFLSKFSYGSYDIGANSANILVQDRVTGQIVEEKIAAHVRLAIRLIYAIGPVQKHSFQRLLRKYTLRQGIKYNSPSSASYIKPFIKFHSLDMSDVAKPIESFKTFNEFFYRKLRPGARPCENPDDPRTVVSPADSRVTVFKTVADATEIWIKGKNFTVSELVDSPDVDVGALLIFRLAPQDYHRVHFPVAGKVGEPRKIEGQYYTVNPMAIRSGLNVFGENARLVIPVDSPQFGKVWIVLVGAMMVGSCILTAKPGTQVERTDELGYFAFGGSTVVVLFPPNAVEPDSDLATNSKRSVETLVKVGMSVAHSPEISEYVRSFDTRINKIRLARRSIAGGGSYLPFALD